MVSAFLTASVIFLGGMTASFFFSGSEIGYYRISRAKLVLDSLTGCKRSRFLLWLVNHPAIFISTVLLGNNLANNFVSLGSVLLFQVLFPNSSAALLSTVVATPIVFIYGELLPKSIFLQAPTRLMKRTVPVFWILVPLFMPVSLFLSGLNLLIAFLLGEKSRHYALQMTDTELQNIMGEGKSAGILRASQQTIAEKIYLLQSEPLEKLALPLKNFPLVHEKMTREEMIQIARKAGASWILTQKDPRTSKKLQPDGFYYFSDLLLTPFDEPLVIRPILEIAVNCSFSEAIGEMLKVDVPFAILKNPNGESLGLLRRDGH